MPHAKHSESRAAEHAAAEQPVQPQAKGQVHSVPEQQVEVQVQVSTRTAAQRRSANSQAAQKHAAAAQAPPQPPSQAQSGGAEQGGEQGEGQPDAAPCSPMQSHAWGVEQGHEASPPGNLPGSAQQQGVGLGAGAGTAADGEAPVLLTATMRQTLVDKVESTALSLPPQQVGAWGVAAHGFACGIKNGWGRLALRTMDTHLRLDLSMLVEFMTS